MNELLPTNAVLRSFCTFRLGKRLYGINVTQVREVSPHLPMTAIPQAPPAVRGLFNLRSRIYLALDMGPLLGLPATKCTAESRLVILKADIGQDLGVLVEQGEDILHAREDQIETATGAVDVPTDSGSSSLIAGVCKLPNELMMVVDLARLNEMVMRLFR